MQCISNHQVCHYDNYAVVIVILKQKISVFLKNYSVKSFYSHECTKFQDFISYSVKSL